jgi:hypothetical protein
MQTNCVKYVTLQNVGDPTVWPKSRAKNGKVSHTIIEYLVGIWLDFKGVKVGSEQTDVWILPNTGIMRARHRTLHWLVEAKAVELALSLSYT